jgi:hypothetical protein
MDERQGAAPVSTEPIDLDAAQALADAATPGPWTSWRKIPGVVRIETTTGDALIYRDSLDEEDGQLITEADAEFIAAARTVVPALIAEVQELRELQSQRTNLVEETSALMKTAARLTAESESLANRCQEVADENEQLKAKLGKASAVLPRGEAVLGGKASDEQVGFLHGQRHVWRQLRDALKDGE